MAEPVTYSGYLRLDQLLSAQQPRSSEHDEMLFIVIHQIYELWFKQLLHEFGKLQAELESGGTTHAMRTLRRTLAILKIVVAQLDVLETMTPTQFTRFREWLGTSSGFESAQFRELEAVLGRRDRMMVAQYAAGSDVAAVPVRLLRPLPGRPGIRRACRHQEP
jgi:tryptophan 2,3-dioxygenase